MRSYRLIKPRAVGDYLFLQGDTRPKPACVWISGEGTHEKASGEMVLCSSLTTKQITMLLF